MLNIQRRVVALCRQLRLAKRLASMYVKFVFNFKITTHLRRILSYNARLRKVEYIEIIIFITFKDNLKLKNLI